MNTTNRRSFIKTSVFGGIAAAWLFDPLIHVASGGINNPGSSRVAIISGDNRADMVFQALLPFSVQIKQAINNRRVILKPNNVSINRQLASTHVDTLEGILEFLKSIGKLDNIVIAESAASGLTFEGFSNFGYMQLINKYPVKLVDLDQEPFEVIYVFNERDFKPHPVRISGMMLDPGSYIVSVARMKTHDRVLVTLSLKNIVFGAPVKDLGYTFGSRDKKSDKSITHGGGIRGINYNLYDLAPRLHPDLAVIDGFEGMEGNGPSMGTPVDHRVCVASTDWLAADRIAVELMGVDFNRIGYLSYCAQTGLGETNLDRIEIIGEKIGDHIKPYKLHDNIEKQLIWMNPSG